MEYEVDAHADLEDFIQPISDCELTELKDTINPLQEDDAHGINTYIQACLFVTQKLHQSTA